MTSARTSSRRCGITVFQKSATLSNTRRNAGLGQGHGVTRDLLLEFVQLGQHGIGVDLHRFQLFELVELRLQCVALAAHFAWSTENRRDNDAERLASILPPLTFNSDSFYVGGMTVAVRRNGKASTSEAIKPWSLCKVHEGLRARYWPNQQSRHASHVEKNAQPKDAAEGGEGRLGVVASSLARRLMEDVHLSRGGRS